MAIGERALNPVRLLLNSVIDYAGIYPPSSLDMAEAVHNYANYLAGEWAWILGRFIAPLSRLAELDECLSKARPPRAWHISVLGGSDPQADLELITGYNRRHAAESCSPVIDVIELKVDSVVQIDRALSVFSPRFQLFLEIPISGGARELIAAAGKRGCAKVRTGGITPELFPSTTELADFILLCAETRTPFKATAGLHHPLRSAYPLTYEKSSPLGTMHGFLNVLIASAFACDGADFKILNAVLDERTVDAFTFDDSGIGWQDRKIGNARIREMRERLFLSFGSCSFQEPVSESKALGIL